VPQTPYLPVPHTWATNEVIRAWRLRADVSGAIQLLSRPPAYAGQQTFTGQSPSAGTIAAVDLDTDFYDNYLGHSASSHTTQYYCRFPGWYLCEGSVPYMTAGTSYDAALIGGVQNGGSLTWYYGSVVLTSSTETAAPAVSKLMKLEVTGGVGGTGDYVSLGAENGIPQTLSNSPNSPLLTTRWVSALSGTNGLAVPANPAWPVPPSYVTSAFMNTNVRNVIEFLIYPPIMEAYRNATGSLASQASMPATGTATLCDTITVDNYSAFNTSSGVWTAPVSGLYYAAGTVGVLSNTNANGLSAGLTVTSSNYNSGTTFTIWGGCITPVPAAQGAGAMCRRHLRLNAGDTIALASFQNSASSSAMTYQGGASSTPRLLVIWEGV
jgi:hypothetical protein